MYKWSIKTKSNQKDFEILLYQNKLCYSVFFPIAQYLSKIFDITLIFLNSFFFFFFWPITVGQIYQLHKFSRLLTPYGS